jgi:dihydrofolate reductase
MRKLVESTYVLGRATYEVFAETWPGQTGDLADRINSMQGRTPWVSSS